MSTVAKDKPKREFILVPEGLHLAICIAIIDLGNQHNEFYDKMEPKVYINFELPKKTIKIDNVEKPMTTGREYTVSLHEKANLRKALEGWRGRKFTEEELKGFDLKKVLGKACQIQVMHTTKGDKTYANITSIVPPPEGIDIGKPVNELLHYDMDAANRDEVFAKLAEWIQNKIKASRSYIEDDTGLFSDESEPTDDQMPF